jgi:hypothetical protein
MWETFETSPRDILIHRVRVGEITPEEAEIEAQHLGFAPLATKPNPIDYEPAKMPYWSLPMALAWIAWRNIEQVREHCAEYRENWLHWFPASWNVPTGNGLEFKRIDGYELRSSRQITVTRLTFTESYLARRKRCRQLVKCRLRKGKSSCLSPWPPGTLSRLGKTAGKVVEIPQRNGPTSIYSSMNATCLTRRT